MNIHRSSIIYLLNSSTDEIGLQAKPHLREISHFSARFQDPKDLFLNSKNIHRGGERFLAERHFENTAARITVRGAKS